MTEFRKDDSVGEEVSAVGERVKGATKNAVGAVTVIEHSRGKASGRMLRAVRVRPPTR